ncbi:hypothetical protein D3C84_1175770 [compost metagenome]
MDIIANAKRKSMLKLREQLVAVEEDRIAGKKGASIDDVASLMQLAIQEVLEENRR